jgi:ABC-type transport system involved in Fe-S cluster assembly fused permease/ATPase subunit
VVFTTIILRAILVAQPLALRAVVDDLHHDWVAKLFLFVGIIAVADLASTICWYSTSRLRTQWETSLGQHGFTHTIGLSADYHLNKSTPHTIQEIERGQSITDLAFIILFDLLPNALDLVNMIITNGKVFAVEVCFTMTVMMVVDFWLTMRRVDTHTYRAYIRSWYLLDKLKSGSLAKWREVSEMGNMGYEEARQKELSENVTALYRK